MIRFLRARTPVPCLTAGQRRYAIGDVHGRLDLLDRLLELIRADSDARGPAEVTVVQLGDFIDRGPESAGVLRRLREPLGWAASETLRGNHEDAMLLAIEGDAQMMGVWLRNGGWATIASFGLDTAALDALPSAGIAEALRAAITRDELSWLSKRPLSVAAGDYLFVHAGVRPGQPLDRQADRDLLWIRDEFLRSTRWHGAVVVHGHSMVGEAELLPNRVNVDTGAYDSGRLTAIGLEGGERWLVQT